MSDEKHARAETGAMQFGDDWPGVFIRGDNAAYYAMQLQAALDAAEDAVRDPIAVAVLRGLVSELNGCRVTGDGTPPATQHLCAFGDALRAERDATARVVAAARALRAAAAAEIAAEDTVTSDRAAADARIIAILDARTAGEQADVELDAALAALDARDGSALRRCEIAGCGAFATVNINRLSDGSSVTTDVCDEHEQACAYEGAPVDQPWTAAARARNALDVRDGAA